LQRRSQNDSGTCLSESNEDRRSWQRRSCGRRDQSLRLSISSLCHCCTSDGCCYGATSHSRRLLAQGDRRDISCRRRRLYRSKSDRGSRKRACNISRTGRQSSCSNNRAQNRCTWGMLAAVASYTCRSRPSNGAVAECSSRCRCILPKTIHAQETYLEPSW
jgi:hypothetical protein